VIITLYDASGKQVKLLMNGTKPAGAYTIEVKTSKLSKGIYYYKMRAGAFTATKKMILE
jgi:hypothetical protein